MKLIRNGVFETNSSSCHSISIRIPLSNNDYDTIIPDENGNIEIITEDFGWQQITYDEPRDKLAYLMIYIRDWVYSEEEKSIFSERLLKVVKDHTGCNSLILKPYSDSPYCDGYIDHQSAENNHLHWIFNNEFDLKNFIFNPQSYIETDNDNY